jgi:hypothetical protein
MGARARAKVAWLGFAVLWVACAGGQGPSDGEGGLRVAIAPLNLATPVAPGLEDAEGRVGDELIRYLQGRGAHVGIVHRDDALRTWDQALRLLGDRITDPEERLASVAAVFTLALREQGTFEFDLLVFPSLVFRDARVRGRTASWDGVRRRLRVRASRDASSLPFFRDWDGEISGLSLQVEVYEPDGRHVFEGFGGLDLTHDPVLVGSAVAPRMLPQAEILENPEHVREGVARALGPYVSTAGR